MPASENLHISGRGALEFNAACFYCERKAVSAREDNMRLGSLFATLIAAFTILHVGDGVAAEIRVLSIPPKAPIDEIAPTFETAMGHKLMIKYAPSSPLLKQIDAGEPFDVILIFPNLVDELIKQGKVAAGTRVNGGAKMCLRAA